MLTILFGLMLLVAALAFPSHPILATTLVVWFLLLAAIRVMQTSPFFHGGPFHD